jgi:hypothetical protein
MQIRRSHWLLAALVAAGWLLVVAGAAEFFTPEDAERVRAGYGKVALMGIFMSAASWLSARSAAPHAVEKAS